MKRNLIEINIQTNIANIEKMKSNYKNLINILKIKDYDNHGLHASFETHGQQFI